MSRNGWRSRWRRPALWCGAVLVVLGLGGCAGSQVRETEAPPPRPERTVIRGLEISPEAGADRVHLVSSGPVAHEVQTSREPPSVTIALSNVTLENVPARVEVGDGVIEAVEARALPGGAARITILTAGAPEAAAEAAPGGLDVVVRTAGPAAPPPAEAARVVTSLGDGAGVRFTFGAEPANLAAFLLSDGKRLVIDAEGVRIPEPQLAEELQAGPVTRVRMGMQGDRLRAVVEAAAPGAFEGYRLEKRPDGFVLLLAAAGAPEKPAPAGGEQARKAPEPSRPSPDEARRWAGLPGGGEISDLGFRQDARWSRIEVTLSRPAPHRVVEAGPRRIVVDLVRTRLPKRFERALDTSAFPGPVRMVAAYRRGPDTRLVVELRKPAPFRVERDETRLTVLVEGGAQAPPEAGVAGVRAAGGEVLVVEGREGAAPAEGPETAGPEPQPETGPVYTGRRLSMDFMDADIRNVLRLIGEVSGLNIVAGDDVQGKVTVRLVDVPWDQALDVILKTRGLGQVREGNVIRVAPAERLAQEEARRLEKAKAQEELAPLTTDIIPVNYASAEEMAERLKAVLSDRGSVSVDSRTNSLLVKDTAENLDRARALVARLDTQTPQVLIEARIVEVSSTFARDLGIQWGGKFVADTAHGNATDWAFPNSIGVSGDTGVGNFAVNFPSAGGAGGPGGALALTLGHVNDVLTLDLRLSAIETSGRGRVISSPRVTTLDNKTAEISQGIEIPFTTATQEKIETQSISYKLRLNVTPHVTADRSIIMKIEVSKDAPSTTFVAVDSKTPAKETRAATTEVLVKDGETTVIGGIITNTQSNTEFGVPFLSKIPVLGWLFKRKDKRVDKTELIIFITPKIVNRQPLPEGRSL